MDIVKLARDICRLRQSDYPSCIIFDAFPARPTSAFPEGVLLIKPSSGHMPEATVADILDRLQSRFRYEIRSVAWWQGGDIRREELMSLHYQGFHQVAHAGVKALSAKARTRLEEYYGTGTLPLSSEQRFVFSPDLARTPYDLIADGISPAQLNELWEQDHSREPMPFQAIQRLDEDAFCLALRFPVCDRIPASLHNTSVLLLNGFYALLEQDFATKGCIAIRIRRGAASTISWEALRSDFAGKTNPFQAAPGTVRGDAARGLLLVEKVSMLANVIHLSASEAEGQREVERVWWEAARLARVFRAAA